MNVMELRTSQKRKFPDKETLCPPPTLADENMIEVGNLSLEFHFEELKNKIKPLLNILGKTPNTSLEKALIGSEHVSVNPKLIRDSENLLIELTTAIENQHQVTKDLWSEVNKFWMELDEKNEPHLEFTNAHCSIYEALKTLKTEYLKRKQQKALRIAQYIGFLRAELTQIWTHCLISEEEKLTFTPFYETTFTEELLETHKKELEKWKIYQEKNQEVLQKAKKREEMWKKLRELEAKADDPARFVNRGGTLLKDQTMHASIVKSLPKLEAELKKLASQFEMEHGRKVTILGQDIHSLIDREWEVYNNEKAMKKQITRSKVRQSIAPTRMGPPASANSKSEKRPPPTPTLPKAKRKCFNLLSNENLDLV